MTFDCACGPAKNQRNSQSSNSSGIFGDRFSLGSLELPKRSPSIWITFAAGLKSINSCELLAFRVDHQNVYLLLL